MKTSLFALLILCGILSCSKSSDPSPTATVSYVSMKINGVEWKSSLGAGAITAGSFSGTGALEVTGGREILAMTLINCSNIGTVYKFEETNDRLFQFTKQASKVSYFIGKDSKGSSGIFTITKTKVVGTLTAANATFSGIANGSDGSKITITEGKVVNAGVE